MDSLPASSLQRCGPNDSNKVIPLNPYLSTIIGEKRKTLSFSLFSHFSFRRTSCWLRHSELTVCESKPSPNLLQGLQMVCRRSEFIQQNFSVSQQCHDGSRSLHWIRIVRVRKIGCWSSSGKLFCSRHHGSMVGFGVIPSVWASKEEFVSDPGNTRREFLKFCPWCLFYNRFLRLRVFDSG